MHRCCQRGSARFYRGGVNTQRSQRRNQPRGSSATHAVRIPTESSPPSDGFDVGGDICSVETSQSRGLRSEGSSSRFVVSVRRRCRLRRCLSPRGRRLVPAAVASSSSGPGRPRVPPNGDPRLDAPDGLRGSWECSLAVCTLFRALLNRSREEEIGSLLLLYDRAYKRERKKPAVCVSFRIIPFSLRFV